MALPSEPIFTNPRIPIPKGFPDILKQFTKAAIRTQPRDMLVWSAAYFRAMATNSYPPVKERIEFISNDKSSWISLGLLRVLHRQLGGKEYVSAVQIKTNWDGLCLEQKKFNEVYQDGNFTNKIHWTTFLALVCHLATQDITDALRLFCEVVTNEPEGYPARVPYNIVSHVYLTIVEKIGNHDAGIANTFLQYLADCSETQDAFVHPGNFFSSACPRLI